MRSLGSSSRRSSTPQVKAPCAPPPCSARSTRTGSRFMPASRWFGGSLTYLETRCPGFPLAEALSAIVRPPEAEPVSAARTLVAAASEMSGPPLIDSTTRAPSQTRQRGDHAPKPTRLATLIAGRTSIGAGIHACAQRRQAPAVDDDERQEGSCERRRHRPHAPIACSDVAPQRSSARNAVSTRGSRTRHRKLTLMTTTSGSPARSTGGAAVAMVAAIDLGRIELTGGRGALAHELVRRGRLRRAGDVAP